MIIFYFIYEMDDLILTITMVNRKKKLLWTSFIIEWLEDLNDVNELTVVLGLTANRWSSISLFFVVLLLLMWNTRAINREKRQKNIYNERNRARETNISGSFCVLLSLSLSLTLFAHISPKYLTIKIRW